jgi:hypothetical protein
MTVGRFMMPVYLLMGKIGCFPMPWGGPDRWTNELPELRLPRSNDASP